MVSQYHFENKLITKLIPLLAVFFLATTGCKLVDGQDVGTDALILNSVVLSATGCSLSAAVAETYNCQPKVSVSNLVNSDQLSWELGNNHTCAWAQINPSTGQLFGTPEKTDMGNCVIAFRVSTSGEPANDYSFAVKVQGPKITFSPNNCSTTAPVDNNYQCDFDATTPLQNAQFTWSLASDNKCAWASIDPATGVVSGKPSLASVGSCVLSVSTSVENLSSSVTKLTITVPQVAINIVANNCSTTAPVDNNYQCDFDATVALSNPQFTWSLASDNKCAWASIDPATGVVSGKPSLASVGSCVLSVNASVQTLTSNSKKTLTVPPVPVTVTASCSTTIDAGSPFTCSPSASAPISNPQYVWSLSPSSTCSWASINATTGQITGTPLIYSTGNCQLDITASLSSTSAGHLNKILQIQTKGYNELLLPDSQGVANEKVGSAVSIDGNWAVVGSPNDGSGAGSAAIYHFNGSTWNLTATLTSPDPSKIKAFGYSVSVLGNSILIGAPYSQNPEFHEGAVVAYEFNGTNWNQSEIIWSDKIGSKSQLSFGAVVDLDGTQAIVGTSHYNGEAAYILQKAGSTWSIATSLPFPGIAAAYGPDRIKASISGSIAVVSDINGGTNYSGEVRIYRKSNGAWALDGILSGAYGFGASVDTNSGRVLIGSPDERTHAGSAYLYEYGGSSWIISKTFKAVDEASYRYFGESVALNSTQAVIGTPGNGQTAGVGVTSGSAYVYTKGTSDWTLVSKLMPTTGQVGDAFGISIGISGLNIVVGADLYNFAGATDTGAAYIFRAK